MREGDHLGKYRLTRQIGAGAMGVVWAALNEDTHKEVAIKLLSSPDQELRRRLLREAKACGRLEHRNIVTIYDAGSAPDGEPFLVMQLLSGETLSRRLARLGRLPPHVAASIGAAVASGLDAAHAMGIVHRDLKPDNVFLHRELGTSGEVVKILDFGVSRVEIANDASSTAPFALIGSPAYMSPEQAVGSSDVGPRSDIWSLGVLLFEMLAGARPFRGSTAGAALAQVLTAPIPMLTAIEPRVSPSLAAIIHSCLEREIERRPARAGDLAGRLLAHAAAPGHGHDADEEQTNLVRVDRLMSKSPGGAIAATTAPLSPQTPLEDEPEKASPISRSEAPLPSAGAIVEAPVERDHDPSDAQRTALFPLGAPPHLPTHRDPAASRSALAGPPSASSSTTPLAQPDPAPQPPVGSRRALGAAITILGLAGLLFVVVLSIRGRRARSFEATPAISPAATMAPPSASSAGPPLEAEAAPAPTPTAPEPPAAPASVEAAPASKAPRTRLPDGTVIIHANAPSRVFLDEQAIGITPLAPISVRPGPHRLRFRHTVLGDRTVTVDAKPGKAVHVSIDFTQK